MGTGLTAVVAVAVNILYSFFCRDLDEFLYHFFASVT